MIGDLNAKAGQSKTDAIIEALGLGDRNEHCDRLAQRKWNCRHKPIFSCHPQNLYTWKSPRADCINQIDFIMINRWFRDACMEVEPIQPLTATTIIVIFTAFTFRTRRDISNETHSCCIVRNIA